MTIKLALAWHNLLQYNAMQHFKQDYSYHSRAHNWYPV
jgi:hypothetical protein